MFRLVPPAGTPISLKNIIEILGLWLKGDPNPDYPEITVADKFGSKYAVFVNSGRSALFLILEALKKAGGSDKNEVLIPAYTCFSVASAIIKSDLKIRLIDIDPDTMDYAYSGLSDIRFDKVLAILSSNLFGLAGDYDRLTAIARENRIFLIDDAAQSMGLSVNGRMSGTFGKAGFFSLGRGKNLSAYSGGILLTDDKSIASESTEIIGLANSPGSVADITALCKLSAYGLFLKPSFYRIPGSLPFLGLGETVFDTNFKIGPLTKLQKLALISLLPKLRGLNNDRAVVAGKLARGISKVKGYGIPGYDEENCPSYLRLPVFASSRSEKNRLIAELNKRGISASGMYPSIISEIPQIATRLPSAKSHFPGASYLADRLVTLPTHSYVNEDDIEKIISIMERVGNDSK